MAANSSQDRLRATAVSQLQQQASQSVHCSDRSTAQYNNSSYNNTSRGNTSAWRQIIIIMCRSNIVSTTSNSGTGTICKCCCQSKWFAIWPIWPISLRACGRLRGPTSAGSGDSNVAQGRVQAAEQCKVWAWTAIATAASRQRVQRHSTRSFLGTNYRTVVRTCIYLRCIELFIPIHCRQPRARSHQASFS